MLDIGTQWHSPAWSLARQQNHERENSLNISKQILALHKTAQTRSSTNEDPSYTRLLTQTNTHGFPHQDITTTDAAVHGAELCPVKNFSIHVKQRSTPPTRMSTSEHTDTEDRRQDKEETRPTRRCELHPRREVWRQHELSPSLVSTHAWSHYENNHPHTTASSTV